MAKSELGSRRHCENCGSKFFDLNRKPILCPRCNTRFVPPGTAVRYPAPGAGHSDPASNSEQMPIDLRGNDSENDSPDDTDRDDPADGSISHDADDADERIDDDNILNIPRDRDE